MTMLMLAIARIEDECLTIIEGIKYVNTNDISIIKRNINTTHIAITIVNFGPLILIPLVSLISEVSHW